MDEILNYNEQIGIRRDKLKALADSGRDPFVLTNFDCTHHSADIIGSFESLEGIGVSVAGRIMSKRDMGKACFCDILDGMGRIQVYVKSDKIGDDAFSDFKKLDIGDICGVTGEVFRTKRGEISVSAASVTLLSKALRPLPEKFHGLRDPELRYRQRSVDLIMSPESRQVFQARTRIVREIRSYLDSRGYLEVETPILNTLAGGANARPFITKHNTLDIDMYLRIATELHLKRLIIGGFERVYEIGRLFRNEGMDHKHNPEFTTIEFYESYANCNTMMDITEEMLSRVAVSVHGGTQFSYQGTELDFKTPWPRMTMAEAVMQHTGVDFLALSTVEAAEKAKNLGLDVKEGLSWGELLYETFDRLVEHKLTGPVFITQHPVDVSPLAKRLASDPRLTDRFELFVCGMELANAFSELNDPIDQRERFTRQAALREQGDDEAQMLDEEFLEAMEYGMPPTGGEGIGIDRLAMLLTDRASIRDVILFPTMKPIRT